MNQFTSTRGGVQNVSAPEAVLNGIAPDGGLYIRDSFLKLDLESMRDMSFVEISKMVLNAFMDGYTKEELDGCVERAYKDRFSSERVTPLVKVGDMHVLELFHGPTAAFKDVALSLLPQLMTCAMKKAGRKEEIVILTATSGDTGSAALTGFQNVPGVRIIVFYPEHGISPIQRAQMTTINADNVGVCAVNGNFDDAQTGVKKIFREMPEEFKKENGFALSSANSINIGRLVPQIVYYFSAYMDMVREGSLKMGEKINFCVPTGNFGDILAGYYAKEMGLPAGRLICASNANNVLTDFIRTGTYDRKRPFYITSSPSMDILVSSNLERLVYHVLGDTRQVSECMRSLSEKGSYTLPEAAMEKIRECFACGFATDEQVDTQIRALFEETGYTMDPHTAVAWKCAKDYRQQTGDAAPCVVLATASPCKFPYSVLMALGESVPEDAQEQLNRLTEKTGISVPAPLDGVLSRKVRFGDVIDPSDMMKYVQEKITAR